MATFAGALILVILGCVAVYGYMSESEAAKRLGRNVATPPREPGQPSNQAESGTDAS